MDLRDPRFPAQAILLAENAASSVDVVVPAFNESPAAILETILALRAQRGKVQSITIVDDCSPAPVGFPAGVEPAVHVHRQLENGGISAARNAGIRRGTAEFVACVDVEILPEPNWLEVCLGYLAAHSRVGLVTVHTSPLHPERALSRWRMLVQEPPCPAASGPVRWAIGHAMVFRREALDQVGGFNERMTAGEDVDISYRLKMAGWDVHFTKDSSCRSVQDDTIPVLASAEYKRFCRRARTGNGFVRCVSIFVWRFAQRTAKHVLWGRWVFLPVEIKVLAEGVRLSWRYR